MGNVSADAHPSVVFEPVIRNSEIFRFESDLEFVRPIYFAKNIKKIVPKINLFSVEYLY